VYKLSNLEIINYKIAFVSKKIDILLKRHGVTFNTHVTQYLNRSVKSCRTADYNQQDAMFHSLFISVRSSTCFTVFPSSTRS